MKPPYKLRWIVKKNKVTAEQVRKYAEENDVSMMAAKMLLAKETAPVLQYWDDGGSFAVMTGEWKDVPYIVEEHE